MDGLIDEFAVYNRALSPDEIAAIYAAGSADKCKQTPIRLQVTRQPGGQVAFTWESSPGRVYQLQYASGLTQGAWTNLGTPITATDTNANASDNIGSEQQRFYRVGLLP